MDPTNTGKILTSDLCDAHEEAAVAEPLFNSYGGLAEFFGQISTLKVFEDNTLVRDILASPGDGKVLVIDGGGSLRCALIGGNLARLAASNGWRGILVYGSVRDSEELRDIPIGIKALAVNPRRSQKGLHSGRPGVDVRFAGVIFQNDSWIYTDCDGIVVSSAPIH